MWGALVSAGARFLPAAGRFLGRNAGSLLVGAGAARSEALKQIPRLEDEVTVEVVGQPGATKKQLYYLALATAFGMLRRYDVGMAQLFLDAPSQALMVEYDAADNWVRATVRYNTGLASSVTVGNTLGSIATQVTSAVLPSYTFGLIPGSDQVAAAIGNQVANYYNNNVPGAAQNALYSQAVVYSGPRDSVVGGPWNFYRPAAPGIPSSSASPGVPRLPFAGQIVLTTDPVVFSGATVAFTPNPAPPGDNRSRGTFPVAPQTTQDPSVPQGTTGLGADDITRLLVPLVFAALTNPASADLATFPQPSPGPGGR